MKTCLWSLDYSFNTECGETHSFKDNDYAEFEFCPFCGKSIKYVTSKEKTERDDALFALVSPYPFPENLGEITRSVTQ